MTSLTSSLSNSLKSSSSYFVGGWRGGVGVGHDSLWEGKRKLCTCKISHLWSLYTRISFLESVLRGSWNLFIQGKCVCLPQGKSLRLSCRLSLITGMGSRAPQAPFPSPYKTQAGYMGSLRYQVPQGNNDQPSRRGSSGGRFKREGIYVYLWLIHVEVWQKTTKFCRAVILQLKK